MSGSVRRRRVLSVGSVLVAVLLLTPGGVGPASAAPAQVRAVQSGPVASPVDSPIERAPRVPSTPTLAARRTLFAAGSRVPTGRRLVRLVILVVVGAALLGVLGALGLWLTRRRS